MGGHWAFVANVVVSVPLCCIDIGKWFPTPKSLQINSTAYDPEGQPLRYTQIISAMEGTREIFKDPIGIACIVIVLLLMVLGIMVMEVLLMGVKGRSCVEAFRAGRYLF